MERIMDMIIIFLAITVVLSFRYLKETLNDGKIMYKKTYISIGLLFEWITKKKKD